MECPEKSKLFQSAVQPGPTQADRTHGCCVQRNGLEISIFLSVSWSKTNGFVIPGWLTSGEAVTGWQTAMIYIVLIPKPIFGPDRVSTAKNRRNVQIILRVLSTIQCTSLVAPA